MNLRSSIAVTAAMLVAHPTAAQDHRFEADPVVTVRENFVACDVLSISLHHSWLLENLALDHLAERRDTTGRVDDHGACLARSFRRQLLDRLAQAGDGAIRGTCFECR
jgi:hypothetical protein